MLIYIAKMLNNGSQHFCQKILLVSLWLNDTFLNFQVKRAQIRNPCSWHQSGLRGRNQRAPPYDCLLTPFLPSFFSLSFALPGSSSSKRGPSALLRPLWCLQIPVYLQLHLWRGLSPGGGRRATMSGCRELERGCSRMPRWDSLWVGLSPAVILEEVTTEQPETWNWLEN